MDDIHAVVAELDGIARDRDRIAGLVRESSAQLGSAAGILAGLDDPSARGALREVERARSELREALASWLHDHETRAAALRQRLTS